MKKARGQTKHLVIVLGDVQHLVGKAIGYLRNDRDPSSYEIGMRDLEEAFDLCLRARGLYEPVEEEDDQKAS